MPSKKQPKFEAEKVPLPFEGVNKAQVNIRDFSSGLAGTSRGKLTTTGQLSKPLQGIKTAAFGDLSSSQDAIREALGRATADPNSLLSQIQSGEGAVGAAANLQRELLNRQLTQRQSDIRMQLGRAGVGSSTAQGALQASLLNDANIREMQLQNEAINQALSRGQSALQSGLAAGGFNQGLVNQLFNIASQPAGLANTNLFNLKSANLQAQLANQAAENQARMMTAQAAASGRPSFLGQLVGTLGGLGTQFAFSQLTGQQPTGPGGGAAIDPKAILGTMSGVPTGMMGSGGGASPSSGISGLLGAGPEALSLSPVSGSSPYIGSFA